VWLAQRQSSNIRASGVEKEFDAPPNLYFLKLTGQQAVWRHGRELFFATAGRQGVCATQKLSELWVVPTLVWGKPRWKTAFAEPLAASDKSIEAA